MSPLSKIFLATAALATITACSSEMSEEEQAIYDERLEEEAGPTNLTAIVQNNPDLSTASTMVAISGIAVDLKDDGPFTVFVANNEAFDKMGQDKVNELMTADDKSELASIARFGLVKGDMKSTDIAKAITDGGGTASLTTLEGGNITATMEGDSIILEDGAGNKVNVIEADIESSNGTVHIIDQVLMPK
ncbi:fasciclin domain-containing protein [Parasphingorhabdus cellanae]|uniref:Fasciclin domain-containing protein n=1 Tax=Parasphingorhabdus cellanae TaxID=2806553 RepID=A0ABX7T4L6_9SPHN|nr:fasciclin domain-containing protein [Parasphingorhabdus cellanae]QTD55745.1 fasciclin domain-containing protein [Parasphingorhabdus cellanae]